MCVDSDVTAQDVFQKTTSGVMSKEGEPDVTLYAFDMWNQTGKTYESRYNILLEVIYQQPHVYDVPYSTINTRIRFCGYIYSEVDTFVLKSSRYGRVRKWRVLFISVHYILS